MKKTLLKQIENAKCHDYQKSVRVRRVYYNDVIELK